MSDSDDEFRKLLSSSKVTIAPPETADDARHRRRKDWLLFNASLAGAGVLAIVSLFVAFGPWASAAQQALAANLLTAIVGGFFGYLFGRKSAE